MECLQAISFTAGCGREDFGSNRIMLLAVVKEIEIIGEAASKVSVEQRSISSDAIPWPEVIGMRNHLAHGYFDWDLDVVWQTVQSDLPSLIVQLESLLETR